MIEYTFDKNYNKNECDKYIACCYSIKNNKDDPTDDIDDTKPLHFVKYRNEDDEEKKTQKYEKELYLDKSFKFMPMLHQSAKNNLQRDIFVIFGMSGSGKSVLTNKICELYKSLNPKQTIYFISNNNVYRDTSLNHGIYKFIKLDDLIAKYEDEDEIRAFKTNNDFDNSLIVFDDIDLSENKKKKTVFFSFLGIILKFKRKNLINVIYTTHDVSDYRYTSSLLIEMTCYILYTGNLKNRNNRVLEQYLKLNNNEIRTITDNKLSRWTCINTQIKTVITENSIYSLA